MCPYAPNSNVYEDNTMLNSKLTKTMIISSVLIASCGIAGVASAALSEVQNKAVAYSDLDLSQQAGQEALYQRLKQATKNVCGAGGQLKGGDLSAAANVRKCYRASLNDAVKSVGNKSLEELHQSS